MRADPIGLYVHIPFCKRKCDYCDFCSFAVDSVDWRREYIEALCREIRSYRGKGLTVDTVFFGGGTPSLLSGAEFRRITDAIRESFVLSDLTEFTLEANPGATRREDLLEYISCGVNRISMGLQSIHENELKILGRIHLFDDFKDTLATVRACGITNVNVDLMYGIPEQTKESLEETLRTITTLSPEHISVYGLIMEEGTPFWQRQDSLNLPDADTECDMYELACRILSEAGYGHYEISNYAKRGFESEHNLKYWRGKEYVGVGVAAHSYLDGVRYGNSTDVLAYISGVSIREDSDKCDTEEEREEYVMLKLRMREGFSLEEYSARFGEDFLSAHADSVNMLIDQGYAVAKNGRFALTEKGFYVSNSIICELT